MEKQTRQNITKNTINKMVSLNTEGLPQTKIAKKLNLNQSTVSKYINKPENKDLATILKDRLKNKYVTLFTARKIREEKQALELSNYASKPNEVNNETIYQSPEQIEKYLQRQDRSGLDIAKSTGILESNTIRFGDDNTQNIVISPAYQQFIDFQVKQEHLATDKPLTIDTQGHTIDSDDVDT